MAVVDTADIIDIVSELDLQIVPRTVIDRADPQTLDEALACLGEISYLCILATRSLLIV